MQQAAAENTMQVPAETTPVKIFRVIDIMMLHPILFERNSFRTIGKKTIVLA
jgi:hypothetical protein